jgi:hypothetical protein
MLDYCLICLNAYKKKTYMLSDSKQTRHKLYHIYNQTDILYATLSLPVH